MKGYGRGPDGELSELALSIVPGEVFEVSEKFKIETELIHGGVDADVSGAATAVPIVQSSAFAYQSAESLENVFAGREAGFVYTRLGNPTLMALERRMAVLEGGIGSVACSSGMAAVNTVAAALTGAGDEIVSSSSVFGGTYSLFSRVLKRQGVKTSFVNATDPDAYKAAITDKTKMIFVETIGNPRMDVPGIRGIADVAHEAGVALVVDNTLTTPVMLRPAELGASIVVHSLSKYVNGHGNTIGGVIVDAGTMDWSNGRYAHIDETMGRAGQMALLAYLRTQVHRDMGCCLAPFNAFLLLMGVESLAVRIERQCFNAAAAAARLGDLVDAGAIRYPGLEEHPDHETARDQFGGLFGGLLTFRAGSRDRAFAFINKLKCIRNLVNLGDARTLAVHPASTFCRDLSDEERLAMGVTDDLVRLSFGLEHIDDIWNDLEQALKE